MTDASGASKRTLLKTLSQGAKCQNCDLRSVGGWEATWSGISTRDRFLELCRYLMIGILFAARNSRDETATIREVFEFSALLRKRRGIARAEKLAYVDEIINLLELGNHQDVIVGSLTLDLEKRLILRVEVSAKPCPLFFDEPTSLYSL